MANDELNPEEQARQVIDAKLVEAGWVTQNRGAQPRHGVDGYCPFHVGAAP